MAAMKIQLTGPLKDLADSVTITLKDTGDSDKLEHEINKTFPEIGGIPYRISVNGKLVAKKSNVSADDRVELVTLLHGG